MKVVLNSILLVFFIFFVPVISSADNSSPEGFDNYFNNVSNSLELTDEQKTEVRPIFLSSFKESESIFQKYGFNPAKGERPSIFKIGDMKKEIEQSEAQTDEKLRKILSDEQMEDLKEFRKQEAKKIEQEYEDNKK